MKIQTAHGAILRSSRQLNLFRIIEKTPGITFKEIYTEMRDRPKNDAGVRMALDRLEELKLIRRTPERRYGIRGRLSGGVIKWYPANTTTGEPAL